MLYTRSGRRLTSGPSTTPYAARPQVPGDFHVGLHGVSHDSWEQVYGQRRCPAGVADRSSVCGDRTVGKTLGHYPVYLSCGRCRGAWAGYRSTVCDDGAVVKQQTFGKAGAGRQPPCHRLKGRVGRLQTVCLSDH